MAAGIEHNGKTLKKATEALRTRAEHSGFRGVVGPGNIIQEVGKVAGKATDVATGAGKMVAENPIGAIMFGPPVLTGVSGLLGWIGEKTGIEFLAKFGRGSQVAIKNFTEKTVEEALGGNPVSDAVAIAAKKSTTFISNAIDKSAKLIRLDKVASTVSERAMKKHSSKLGELLGAGKTHELPYALRDHAKEITKLLSETDISKINHAELEAAKEKFIELTKAAKASGINSGEGIALKEFEKIIKTAGKAVNANLSMDRWKNGIGGAVKELPQSIGKSKVLHGVANTTFIVADAARMFSTARGFWQNLASLKEMSRDITGKPVSTWSVLIGKVPAPVAEARSKLLKNFAVSEVTGAMSLGATVVNASRGRVSPIAFVAPMVVGMGANAMIGESALPYYTALSQAHASGQQIPTDAYAQLIDKASPQMRVRGEGNVFSKKVAEQYAAEKASPAQVMREIADGGLMKRVNALIAANEAAKPINVASKNSHVGKLKEPAAKIALPKKEQPVIGDYTKQIVTNAEKANHALTAGV